MHTRPSSITARKLLAALAAACCLLASPASHALALGQLRVLSGIGEPLLAEIEIPQIAPAELARLQAGIGSPAQFEAAGMAYHPSLREATLSVLRRPDGRMFLRIAGRLPVNEPFMELLVLANGGGAPVLRDYTLLFDPRAPRATPIALGQARVVSARGEPLRAEIDLPQLPGHQAGSARLAIASAAQFEAAGMRYHPALHDLRMSLGRRADGNAFVSITSDRPFDEASLDLLVQAESAAGRTVRDYSLPVAAPQVAAAPPPSPRVAAGPVTAAPAQPSAVEPAAPAPTVIASLPPSPSPGAAPAAAPQRKVKVRAGDTLSRIARSNKPVDISLDQMLVALLRANPDAFIDGNVNLLKAGADLRIPGADQAAAVAPDEATSVLALQSRNFDEYRRRLAGDAPRMAASSRQASGKIEATVSDKRAAPPSRNRLRLSSGSMGRATAEEKAIAARLSRVAEERAARLSREAEAISRLQGPAAAASAASPASAAAPGR